MKNAVHQQSPKIRLLFFPCVNEALLVFSHLTEEDPQVADTRQ